MPKNPQNDRLYAHPSTKNKKRDVVVVLVTKRLSTQLSFSHW